MKQQEKSLALGVFLGYISLAEAVKINSDTKLPDYWSDWHRDTWRYTNHPRYVDEDQWKADAPKGYDAVQLPDYWSDWHRDTWRYTDKPRLANETEWKEGVPKGYEAVQSGAQINQKHKHHHKKSRQAKASAQDWTENHMRHMGKFDDYKEDAPAGYSEHVVWEAPEEDTPDEQKAKRSKEIYEKGVKDAKEAIHKHPKWNVQISKQQLAQAQTPEDGKSFVDSGTDKQFAWTDDQNDYSNEDTFKEETQKITGGAYNTLAQRKFGKKLRKRDDEDPDEKCGSNCAWTDNQKQHMNATSFEEETRKPSIPYKKLVHAQQLAQDGPYRKNAWNDDQYESTNARTWQAETENPTGYQHWLEENKSTFKTGQKLMQTGNRGIAVWPGSKWGYDPDRLTAWNDEQADAMNQGTWEAETNNPTGYQPWLENNKATFKTGQVMAQSGSRDGPYRKNAWNEDQYDSSNSATWDSETEAPTGYQHWLEENKATQKRGQKLMQTGSKGIAVWPGSKWGYDPDRLTAWNDDQADAMNPGTWQSETDTPTGYQHWLENNKATFKTGQVMAQRRKETYPSKDSHSEILPYNHREDHAWTHDQYDQSNKKTWDHETKNPSGYQVQPGFVQKGTYPSKDSHSEVTPYVQRDHSWNEDEFDMSSEKKWDTETKKPTKDTHYEPSFAQKDTYPSKDSHSEILPYKHREDHAWTHDQYDQSNQKTWDHETKNPSGYQVQPGFVQKGTYPSKDSHSEVTPYVQRDHSWNEDEFDMSSEKKWDTETKKPTKDTHYEPSFAQKRTYPSKDSHSEVTPYVQRDHSWNEDEFDMSSEKKWDTETKKPTKDTHYEPSFVQKDTVIRTYPSKDSHSEILPYKHREEQAWTHDQYDQSNKKTWDHETKNPSGYQVQPGFAQVDQNPQSIADAKRMEDYRVETHSKVIPYVVRDHSWNFDEHDQVDFARYKQDTPDGYKEHLTYIKPHPTNVPYMVPPECDAEDQQTNAAKLTEAAEKAFTEGKTEDVKVDLKIKGKIYSSCHTKVKPAPPPPPPTEDDEDCVGGVDVKTGVKCLPGEETKAKEAAAKAKKAAAKDPAAAKATGKAAPAAAKAAATNTTKNATKTPVNAKKVEAKANATVAAKANVTANATAKANVTANATAKANVTANVSANATANVSVNATKNVTANTTKNVTANTTLNATKAIAVNVTKASALNSSKNGTKAIKEVVKALQVNSTKGDNATKILNIKKPTTKSPVRVSLKSNATAMVASNASANATSNATKTANSSMNATVSAQKKI